MHGSNSDPDTETDTDSDDDADRDADHSAGYGDHKADSESEGGAEHDEGAPLLEMEEEEEPAEEHGYKAMLQGLGKEELQEVFEAWRQPRGNHSTNVVAELPAAIKGTAVSLLGKHMYRMNPENKLNEDKWLVDETINSYMWLLQMRDHESVFLAQDTETVKKPSLYFNSFFFENLHSGIERRYNYSAVERFARQAKATAGNLFELDKLIIPVNAGNFHWFLCVAHIQQRRIKVYDSTCGDRTAYLDSLKLYLKDEAEKLEKLGTVVPGELRDLDSWELIDADPKNTPQQTNAFDCGVYTCTFAEYVGQGLGLRFSQKDIVHFRQRITYSLLHAVKEIRGHRNVRSERIISKWDKQKRLCKVWQAIPSKNRRKLCRMG